MLTTILDTLIGYDQRLFLFLNGLYHNDALDFFFVHLTDLHKKPVGVVFMLGLLFWGLISKYKKQFWRPLLFVIVCVGMTDLICYRLIKASVERPRPFQTEAIQGQVRKVAHAHGASFPSNHSANSFAGATSLSYLFPQYSIFFFIYAALVAFSRIYVGVHFPLDVMVGALIGTGISMLTYQFFRKQIKR